MYLQSTSGLSLVASPPSSSSRQPPNNNNNNNANNFNNNNNNTSGSFASSSSSAASQDKRQRPTANSFAYRSPSPDDDDLPPPQPLKPASSRSAQPPPLEPLLPDLSHLSESERRQIESVLQRQLAEEQQQQQNQASAQLNPSIPFRSNTTTNHSFTANSLTNNSNNNNISSSSSSRVETRRNQFISGPTSSASSNNNKLGSGGGGGVSGNILSSSSFYNNNQVEDDSGSGGGKSSHPLVNSQRHSISDIAQEAKQRYGSIDTGNVCDVCKKTKFSNATAGHACFHCKARSCIRCSFKFTYKNQQLWSCVECKKKQEALLRSAFNKSNSNSKQFASDYILNKANDGESGSGSGGGGGQHELPHENNKTSSSIMNNTSGNAGGRRMLPNIGGGGGSRMMVKQESLDNNTQSTSSRRIGYNNNSTSAQMVTTNATEGGGGGGDIRIPVRRGGGGGAVIAAARQQRHDENYYNEDEEESHHFTSNNNNNMMMNDPASCNSSPSSSVSQHLNHHHRSDQMRQPQQQPTGRKLLPMPYQAINNNNTTGGGGGRSTNLVIKHTDSLSSDPSDLPANATNQNDEDQFFGGGGHLSRKQSSNNKKRTRKQPPLPVSNPNLLKQKLLAKLSGTKQQHSFTSSDDENLNDFDNRAAAAVAVANANNNSQDKKIRMTTGRGGGGVEYEDEEDTEDLNNIDDEELRSTTEYTTNDEMDLESASVSMKANARLNVNMPHNNNYSSHLANRLPVGANNLNNKDEILAAKMSNFLSPTNWQLSLDGKKMIAHVVLRRNVMPLSESSSTLDDSAAMLNNTDDDFLSLGLHVVGGVPNPLTGQPSAYVVNVRKESVSDTKGRLQAGDEIVKWNETLLRGLSFHQAASVMQSSRSESQVELVVERTLDDFVKDQLIELIKDYNTASNDKVNETNHRLAAAAAAGRRGGPNNNTTDANHVMGNVQIKIFFDSYDQKLFVNVLLVTIDQNRHHHHQHIESLFCKLHLISPKNQTPLLTKMSEVCNMDRSSSNQYFVNEAFTFEPVSFNDSEYSLEIELVNYSNKAILGKAKLDLSDETLENQMFELDIFKPSFSNNTQNAINNNNNKSLPYGGRGMQNDTSVESLTKSSSGAGGGGGGGRGRRQLPQLPPPVKKMLPQPPAQKSLPLPPKLSEFQAANRAISQDPDDKYERPSQSTNNKSLHQKYHKDESDDDQSDSESRSRPTLNNNNNIPRRSILPTSSLPPVAGDGGGESTSYSPPPLSSRAKSNSQFQVQPQPARKSSQPPPLSSHNTTDSNHQLQNSDSDVSGYAPQRPSNNRLAQRQSIASPLTTSHHLRGEDLVMPSNKLKQLNKQTVSKRLNSENEMSSSPQLWPDTTAAAAAAAAAATDGDSQSNIASRRQQQDYVASSSPSPPPGGSSASVSDLRRNGVNNNRKPGNISDNLMNLAASTQAVNMDAEDRFLNKDATIFRPLNSQAASQPRLQVNKSLTNINSVKPEKLFSAKLLNQKAQNASRNNLQQLANQQANNTMDSDVGSDLSSPSVRSDSQNKVNLVSQLATNDPNRTTTVSTSVNGATTTTVTNKDPTTPSSTANMAIMDDSNMFENMNLYTTSAGGSTTTPAAAATSSTVQPTSSSTSYQLTPQLSTSRFKEPLTPLQQQQLILLQQQQGGIFLNAMKPKPPAQPPQPVQQQQSYTDGTLSDSALSGSMVESGGPTGANKKRRPSMAKALVILGLSKKSNSATNLTVGKRIGFARVSEEYGVTPELRNRNLSPPGSADSTGAAGAADDKPPKFWSGALKLPHELLFHTFIENLGPGQKVSRQALGLPCQGEIKLVISSPDKQKFTIEVQEIRNLKQSTMYRITPNVYVKFYVFQGNICAEKQKTVTQRRTLTPSFKEPVRFESDFRGKVLQVTVWAEYGKMSTDRKTLMGLAQIVLDDINLVSQEQVTGWYRLYPAGSIISDISVILGQTDLSGTDSGYSISSQR